MKKEEIKEILEEDTSIMIYLNFILYTQTE